MKEAKNKKKKSGGVKKSPFAGNGLSKTAMLFEIATLAGRTLTPPQLNKVKDINPRSLEHVYDEVLRVGDRDNARFALSFILK